MHFTSVRGLLQQYVEAMDHEGSDLTYPALVGLRKQSMEDAEPIFSSTLLKDK